MILTKDYTKKSLDVSSLQINTGYVKSKVIDEDTYAMGMQADLDFAYAAIQSQLLSERNKDLMGITKDLRKFLNRMGVDSTFVKQIQEVLRMGQDLVNISVDIINSTTEDKPIEEVIKDVTGTEGSTDDVINNEVKQAEDSIIPPLERETVINTGKAVVEATKEAAKENNTDVKTSSTTTREAPVAVTPEVVEAAKVNYEDVAKGIDVDVKVDPNDLTALVATGAATAGTAVAATAVAAGIAAHEGLSLTGAAISAIATGAAGSTGLIGTIATTLAPAAVTATAAIIAAAPVVAAAVLLDNADTKAAVENAIPQAVQTYLETLQNGGSRKDAQEAAAEAIRNTEVRPEVNSGGIYTPAVTLGDKGSAGTIVDTIIDAIEVEVGHAIERAGGDVSDFFGGCGCDDECDCADCDGECSSDCGCNDTGCTGYTSCDEAPCDGCSSYGGCSSDNPDCDCSDLEPGNCGCDYGCDEVNCDCGADCPAN